MITTGVKRLFTRLSTDYTLPINLLAEHLIPIIYRIHAAKTNTV